MQHRQSSTVQKGIAAAFEVRPREAYRATPAVTAIGSGQRKEARLGQGFVRIRAHGRRGQWRDALWRRNGVARQARCADGLAGRAWIKRDRPRIRIGRNAVRRGDVSPVPVVLRQAPAGAESQKWHEDRRSIELAISSVHSRDIGDRCRPCKSARGEIGALLVRRACRRCWKHLLAAAPVRAIVGLLIRFG